MSNDLPVADRAQARSILENQRDALRERLQPRRPGGVWRRQADARQPRHRRGPRAGAPLAQPGVQPAGTRRARPRRRVQQPGRPGLHHVVPGSPEVRARATSKSRRPTCSECSRPSRTRTRTQTAVCSSSRRSERRWAGIANPLGVGHMGETHYLVRRRPVPLEHEVRSRDGHGRDRRQGPGHSRHPAPLDSRRPALVRAASRGSRPGHLRMGRSAGTSLVPPRLSAGPGPEARAAQR